MHVNDVWRFVDEMIVHRRNFKARRAQFFHDRVQLVLEQDQVAHNHGIVIRPDKRSPRTESETGLDRQPVNRNMQVDSRKSEPSTGSLIAKQTFSERQTRPSRKKAGRGSEYWVRQVLPPSEVL